MQNRDQKNYNVKSILVKIALFAFVLSLLFIYSQKDTNIQQFTFNNTAFLYEGNQLVGVNTGEKAEELDVAQSNRAQQVSKEADTNVEDAALSTRVVKTPSLIHFDLSEQEQVDTIDYAKQQTKILEQGYTVTIDDKYKYYVKDLDTVEWTKDKILLAYLPNQSYLDYYNSVGDFKPYKDGKKTFTGISITNDVQVTEGYTTGSKYIEEPEDLLFDLFHKDQNRKYDMISDTASIKSIREANEMTDTEFKLDNPNLTDNTVTYNGLQVVTNSIDPILEVVQTFETEKNQSIDFETVQEVDDSMLAGQIDVVTEGKEGKRKITYENQMVNGKVVSTTKIEEEVTKTPVHKVVKIGKGTVANSVTVTGNTVGTSSDAAANASGFIWPSSSRSVTCVYGCYSGHTGIDIQSYYGGPIYAAKAGVVTISGWSNYGYGYHVVIDHGNGVKTLYAHQKQQPPVAVGQYVEQGQVIGFEGATGRVTGEHLHFEVQINGTADNPYSYIA